MNEAVRLEKAAARIRNRCRQLLPFIFIFGGIHFLGYLAAPCMIASQFLPAWSGVLGLPTGIACCAWVVGALAGAPFAYFSNKLDDRATHLELEAQRLRDHHRAATQARLKDMEPAPCGNHIGSGQSGVNEAVTQRVQIGAKR